MPNVTKEFIECAQRLAKSAATQVEKQATDAAAIKTAAELTASTLIEQNLVPANQKAAAVRQLMDHSVTLQVLNKTAQVTYARSQKKADIAAPVAMGKSASSATGNKDMDYRGEQIRESDRALFQGLGLA